MGGIEAIARFKCWEKQPVKTEGVAAESKRVDVFVTETVVVSMLAAVVAVGSFVFIVATLFWGKNDEHLSSLSRSVNSECLDWLWNVFGGEQDRGSLMSFLTGRNFTASLSTFSFDSTLLTAVKLSTLQKAAPLIFFSSILLSLMSVSTSLALAGLLSLANDRFMVKEFGDMHPLSLLLHVFTSLSGNAVGVSGLVTISVELGQPVFLHSVTSSRFSSLHFFVLRFNSFSDGWTPWGTSVKFIEGFFTTWASESDAPTSFAPSFLSPDNLADSLTGLDDGSGTNDFVRAIGCSSYSVVKGTI